MQAQFLLRPRPTVLLCVKTFAPILKISCDARCLLSWGEKLLKQCGGALLLCPMGFSFLLSSTCSSNTLENSQGDFYVVV